MMIWKKIYSLLELDELEELEELEDLLISVKDVLVGLVSEH